MHVIAAKAVCFGEAGGAREFVEEDAGFVVPYLDVPAMAEFTLPGFDLDSFVRATLGEDLGVGLPGGGHDVTAESVIPAEARFAGIMDTRETIVVARLPRSAARPPCAP